jgi:hypothetical protein
VEWDREDNKQADIKDLTSRGIVPVEHDLERHPEKSIASRAWLMGSVAAVVNDVLPAKTIVDEMVRQAAEIMRENAAMVNVNVRPKL